MNPDTQTPDARPQTPDPGAADPGAADAWLTPARFALVLAALLAVTFWRALFGGEAFFYRDYGFLGYPFAHFHRECFWSGDIFPLWNPYVNCGAPFLAQWNTQTLYPGSLIYLLLPLPWSLGFFCVMHLFLGGMGMRALAERWTGSRFGAAVAGVAFVFSGLVLGCVIYPNYLVALGWMPWVALATRRAWQEGGRSIVLAALAGAMQMLSGAPEIILLTWGLLAALLVTELFSVQCSVFSKGAKSAAPLGQSEAKTEHWILNTDYFPTVRRYVSVIALITGLCAAQLLPFFQLLSLSQRSGDAVNTFWSLPGWGWVNLFFPLFMNFQTEQGVFVMIGQSFFPSVYLGIVPLTLALLTAWRVGLRGAGCPPFRVSEGADTLKRGHQTGGVWEVRLLAGATLLAVLLAMGENSPLWGWLRAVLPLGVVRFPVKALLLAAFTVPLLAAWGVALLNKPENREFISAPSEQGMEPLNCMAKFNCTFSAHMFWGASCFILALVACIFLQMSGWPMGMAGGSQSPLSVVRGAAALVPACLLFGVAWFGLTTRSRGLGLLGLLALLAFEPASHQAAFNPTIPASAFEPGLAVAYHASKGALTPAPKLGESRIMLGPLAERALHTQMVPKFYDDFIGQRLAFWGNLNLLDGLPKVNGASTLVTREWNDVEYFLYGTTNPAPANLMDFLGVTHTTKSGELMQWERRTTAMPLVSAGQRVVTEGGVRNARPSAFEAGWNPRETVFVADRPGGAPAANGTPAKVLGTRFSAQHIEVEADSPAPTAVVVAQNHYPSWQATVNGRPVPLLRANHAFQAIAIPAGKSTVRLDYVDWPFRIGALVSLLTGCGCLLLWRRAGSRAHSASE